MPGTAFCHFVASLAELSTSPGTRPELPRQLLSARRFHATHWGTFRATFSEHLVGNSLQLCLLNNFRGFPEIGTVGAANIERQVHPPVVGLWRSALRVCGRAATERWATRAGAGACRVLMHQDPTPRAGAGDAPPQARDEMSEGNNERQLQHDVSEDDETGWVIVSGRWLALGCAWRGELQESSTEGPEVRLGRPKLRWSGPGVGRAPVPN